jgi:hypothetical protein
VGNYDKGNGYDELNVFWTELTYLSYTDTVKVWGKKKSRLEDGKKL